MEAYIMKLIDSLLNWRNWSLFKTRMSNIQLYVQYKRKMQILYDFLSVDPRSSDINSISFFPTKFKLVAEER